MWQQFNGLSPEDVIRLELFKKAVDVAMATTEGIALEPQIERVCKALIRSWNKLSEKKNED